MKTDLAELGVEARSIGIPHVPGRRKEYVKKGYYEGEYPPSWEDEFVVREAESNRERRKKKIGSEVDVNSIHTFSEDDPGLFLRLNEYPFSLSFLSSHSFSSLLFSLLFLLFFFQ